MPDSQKAPDSQNRTHSVGKPVYVMSHIPKTGGTSLRRHVEAHLTGTGEFVDMSASNKRREAAEGIAPWHQRSAAECEKARMIIGHRAFRPEIEAALPGRDIRYLTCLRDPAARWVSNYNFNYGRGHIDQGMDFFAFYERDHNPNIMCQFLWGQFLQRQPTDNATMLACLIEELEQFAFVGILEAYDQFAAFVSDSLGLPPLTKRYTVSGLHHPITQQVTPEIQDRIRDECDTDYTLYNHFAARFQKAEQDTDE